MRRFNCKCEEIKQKICKCKECGNSDTYNGNINLEAARKANVWHRHTEREPIVAANADLMKL